jgi:hypothetical protein
MVELMHTLAIVGERNAGRMGKRFALQSLWSEPHGSAGSR